MASRTTRCSERPDARPEVAQKIIGVVRELDEADDAYFYLMAPHAARPRSTFAAWVTDPARLRPENFAAFEVVLARLKDLLAQPRANAGQPPQQRRMA